MTDALEDLTRLIEELPAGRSRPVVIVVMDEWPVGSYVPGHDDDGRRHEVVRLSPGVYRQIPRLPFKDPTPGDPIGNMWGTPVIDWS